MPQLSSDRTDVEVLNLHDNTSPGIRRGVSDARERFLMMGEKFNAWFHEQPQWKKVLLVVAGFIGALMGILALIFYKYIIETLIHLASSWSKLKHGRIILFVLIFFVGFPPLMGYSTLATLCGMVYGFPYGWPLLASGTVAGSLCSFFVFRYLLHNQAEHLVNSNERYRSFSEVLKDDSSLLLLVLIRLCPLPYSLTNGALAAVPELPALTFFLATVISTPKLLIHTFMGSKLKDLGDNKKSGTEKAVDVISILISLSAVSVSSYVIYQKMQRRLEAYHRLEPNRQERLDELIFGNFDNDIESGNNVELDSNNFDADNFIIEDEDEIDQGSK